METNITLLRALLDDPVVLAGEATTLFIQKHAGDLLERAAALPVRVFESSSPAPAAPAVSAEPPSEGAVLAPLQATVGSIEVAVGDLVRAGQPLAILEAMKMEHVVESSDGRAGR